MKGIIEKFDVMKKSMEKIGNGRILLLTHTDMDGSGPVILMKTVFGDRVDVIHCPNVSASRTIKEKATEDGLPYSLLVVCDISCTENDAEIINRYKKREIVLLDHHITAVELNRYAWAAVQPELIPGTYRDDILYDTGCRPAHSSGTSLLYDYLEACGLLNVPNTELMKKLVFFIAAYDTWDWFELFGGDIRFKDLNTLFIEYGADVFEEIFIRKVFDPGAADLFDDTDRLILRISEVKRLSYCEDIKKAFRTGNVMFNGKYHSFVFCQSSEYMADVFDVMKKEYPDFDLYVIDSGRSISFRSVKKEVNVGAIVKPLGGGGHPGAAGVSIPFETRRSMLEEVLGTTMYFD